MRRVTFTLVVATLAMAAPIAAVDWPQYLGPERNGTYRGPPLLESWGASGPRVVWRKTVGAGFAGPAVVGARADPVSPRWQGGGRRGPRRRDRQLAVALRLSHDVSR